MDLQCEVEALNYVFGTAKYRRSAIGIRRWLFSELSEQDEKAGRRDNEVNPPRMKDAIGRYFDYRSFGDYRWLSWSTTIVVTAILLKVLHPSLLFTGRLPSGGDMTAHILSPDILRDQLLPNWRLSGWSRDWYTGFPANTFYMVPPQLAIVGLSWGPSWFITVVLVVIAAILAIKSIWSRTAWVQTTCMISAATALWIASDLPYGLAFKLVAVSGLLTLPWALALLARFSGAPHPIPGLAAVGGLGFILDQSYTIVGGNIYATMAGEFYFSIALSFTLFGIAFAARGLRLGRNQIVTAALLATGVLCHVAVAVVFLPCFAIALLWVKPSDLGWRQWVLRSARWFTWVALVVLLLSAVWLLPFMQHHRFINNMGLGKETSYSLWLVEKLVYIRGGLFAFTGLALVGGIIFRRGFFLWSSTVAILGAIMFVALPGGILWNPRVLPLYSLGLYLGAVCGLWTLFALVAKALENDVNNRPFATANRIANVLPVAVALVVVVLPIQLIPMGIERPADGNPEPGVAAFSRLSFGPITVPKFAAMGWSEFNFGGFEAKPGWREYRDLMETMRNVGAEYGCGPAVWEYDASLTRFGSPMALMLIPYFTDHCVGSMEGLYFEASQTTPFHFMLQDAISPSPSRAQRNAIYRGLDVSRGVLFMQELGTRYAMLRDPIVVRLANENPDLSLIATSGDWHVYRVADSDLVTPVPFDPVVLEDYPTDTLRWVEYSTAYFAEPRAWPQTVVADGPAVWRRVDADTVVKRNAVREPPVISNVRVEPMRISFDVSGVGSPVRVRSSYFPLWSATGADGPFRSFPNQMIVVPTERHVVLEYKRSSGEVLGVLLFLLGILLLVARGESPCVIQLRRFRAFKLLVRSSEDQ